MTFSNTGSVIWVTGYSGAGKTSVGRALERILRNHNIPVVYLDGDDLRSIFGGRWGYTREERIDLARIYFRLCSHLAAQGFTVVLSAVAMYEEVRQWLREHVSGAQEVYLNVPESERRARDSRTKKLYTKLADSDLYDEPTSADLVVDNYDSMTPEISAYRIFDYLREQGAVKGVDHGRLKHWSEYYSNSRPPQIPSPFAESIASLFPSKARILEVGCGNGRDAFYFASAGHWVTGLDISKDAIAACRRQHQAEGLNASFFVGDIEAFDPTPEAFDVVYSRFSLHAMTVHEEKKFLNGSAVTLKKNGQLFIECRSINDPMARLGEIVSKTERIHGHYRRFIIKEELIEALGNHGLITEDCVESAGLAQYGNEDPVVIRARAIKER